MKTDHNSQKWLLLYITESTLLGHGEIPRLHGKTVYNRYGNGITEISIITVFTEVETRGCVYTIPHNTL